MQVRSLTGVSGAWCAGCTTITITTRLCPQLLVCFFSPSTPYLEREREKGLRERRGVEIEQLGWWIHTWDTWHTETRRHHHHQVAKKPATKPPTINTRTYAEISSDFATLHLEGL